MGWKETRRDEYAKKLKDPRWQKKRLEIMQRDGFKCAECDDTTTTLHVHHKYYRAQTDPWDYPAAALVTLCENCHEDVTAREADRKEGERRLIEALREYDIDPDDVKTLAAEIASRDLSIIDIAWAFYKLAPLPVKHRFPFQLAAVLSRPEFIEWLLTPNAGDSAS